MKIISKIVESNQKNIQKAQGSGQSSEVILNFLDVIAEKLCKIAVSTDKTNAIEIENQISL